MTSEQTNLSVCANQLCGMSGTIPSWIQLLSSQEHDGAADPAGISQPPKPHSLKVSSSHFSVRWGTWHFGERPDGKTIRPHAKADGYMSTFFSSLCSQTHVKD